MDKNILPAVLTALPGIVDDLFCTGRFVGKAGSEQGDECKSSRGRSTVQEVQLVFVIMALFPGPGRSIVTGVRRTDAEIQDCPVLLYSRAVLLISFKIGSLGRTDPGVLAHQCVDFFRLAETFRAGTVICNDIAVQQGDAEFFCRFSPQGAGCIGHDMHGPVLYRHGRLCLHFHILIIPADKFSHGCQVLPYPVRIRAVEMDFQPAVITADHNAVTKSCKFPDCPGRIITGRIDQCINAVTGTGVRGPCPGKAESVVKSSANRWCFS